MKLFYESLIHGGANQIGTASTAGHLYWVAATTRGQKDRQGTMQEQATPKKYKTRTKPYMSLRLVTYYSFKEAVTHFLQKSRIMRTMRLPPKIKITMSFWPGEIQE